MLFLIDSNVAIKSDPLSRDVEPDYDLALRFQQVAGEGHHRLLMHPSSLHDAARDPDETRRGLRERSFARYAMLEAPPSPSKSPGQGLGFDLNEYRALCQQHSSRADRAFAHKEAKAFGPRGRQRQRAYALRDLAAPALGHPGVIRAPAVHQDGAAAWRSVRHRLAGPHLPS